MDREELERVAADPEVDVVDRAVAHHELARTALDDVEGLDPQTSASMADHCRAAIELVTAERGSGRNDDRYAKVVGAAGASLLRLAELAPVADWPTVLGEAEAALALALAWTPPGDLVLRVRRTCNQATAVLQDGRPSLAPERIDAVIGAVDEMLALPAGSYPVELGAALHLVRGHALRRRAGLEGEGWSESLAEAGAAYDAADRLGMGVHGRPTASRRDRALLSHDAALRADDLVLIDRAIGDAETHLDATEPEGSERPGALMEVATLLRHHHQLTGDELDLRRAVATSGEAAHPFLVTAGTTAARQLAIARFQILLGVVATAGDWYREWVELADLVDELDDVIEADSRPASLAVRPAVAVMDAIQEMADGGTPAPAIAASDRLRDHIDVILDRTQEMQWLGQQATLDMTIYDRAGHHGMDAAVVVDRMERLAGDLQHRLDGPGLAPALRHQILCAIAELLARVGSRGGDPEVRVHAREAAKEAVRFGDLNCAAVHPGNHFKAAQLASRLQRNRRSRPSADGWALVRRANALKTGRGPGGAVLISDRERVAAAGDAALSVEAPADAAWVQLALCARLDVFDQDVRAFEDEATIARSAVATQVFLACGSATARANWISDGIWKSLPGPELSTDSLGPLVVTAYRAHERAGRKIVVERDAWPKAQAAALSHVAAALAPLADALPRDGPVDLYLSGWAHTLPLVPILSTLLSHERSVAMIFPTEARNPTPTDALADVQTVAIAGDADGYLREVKTEAGVVAGLFGSRAHPPAHPATRAGLVEGLHVARRVLIAGHAESSRKDPADSFIPVGSERLTVQDILAEDLRHLELVVLSACETFAPEAQVSENPLSLATAFLRAGAAASVGTHWRVDDEVASDFTQQLFTAVALGEENREAYATALHQTSPKAATFSLALNRQMGRPSA